MKTLSKGPEPEVLLTNSTAWNAAFAAAPPSERGRLARWGDETIKAALSVETQGLCAYCEGRLEDVSYAHVEHILPKSKFPLMSHTWSNLTRACQRCNTGKGDYHEPGLEVLNPYRDDVEHRLRIRGGLVDWNAQDERAELTVRQLQLNRLDLVRSRGDRVLAVRDVVERWARAEDPLRSILERGIRLDAREGPFSRAVADLLESHAFPLHE